jgi:hypothetical protein
MYEWNVCRLSCLNLCSWLARSPSIGELFSNDESLVVYVRGPKGTLKVGSPGCVALVVLHVLTFAISIRLSNFALCLSSKIIHVHSCRTHIHDIQSSSVFVF